ncbi:MAG: polysaccharide biosynthesis tyrosine autokinase [Deinococcota bacterium]|nr:polysaccharide biosynthesis tyrosine autokinase [Deinococcota bacterium]
MDRNMDQDNSEVVSFGDLFSFIRRGLLYALAVGLVAAGAAYLISRSIEPSYRARATLLAAQLSPELRSFGVSLVTAPSLDAGTYRAAAVSDPVLVAAMARLGLNDTGQQAVQDFRDSMGVRSEDTRTSSLLHIDVESSSPEEAAQRANAVTAALLAWDVGRASQNLQRIVLTLEEQIASLDAQMAALAGGADTPSQEQQDQLTGLSTLRAQQQTQLSSARALSNSAVGLLEVLQPAPAPLRPVSPRPLLNAALALVLGVFLTYGLMLLRDALNTRVRSVEDLARLSGLPVLAEFPKQAPGTRRLPREASSYLRTNVLFATADAYPKIILVTSAQPGEGKTSTALSLAESFARNDHKTLIVDADMRKPALSKEYNLNPAQYQPLRAHLENLHQDYAPAKLAGAGSDNLYLIPSFEPAPAPSELLHHGFRQRLDEWRQDYDVIIIDSPPVLPVADALILAPLCTGTLLAASPQGSDRRQVQAAAETLQRVGVRMLGVVATNVAYAKGGGKANGYGYGYGYGEQEEEGAAAAPRPAKLDEKVLVSLHKSKQPSD